MDALDIPKFDFGSSNPTAAPVDPIEMSLKEEAIFGPTGGFNPEIPTGTVGGKTISDFINESQQYNLQINNLLQGVPQQGYSTGSQDTFNPDRAVNNLQKSLNRSTPTFEKLKGGMDLGSGSDYERYAQSGNYQALGYTPFDGEEQEYKYGRAMTWGDTVGRALGGASELAWGTFAEGWKGWGRMTDALFSWDASKLMGSEEERYEIAKEQESIFNKYAIFDTEASKDSLWNRQMFGNMLQQAGFAVGAGAQFAMEAYLTAGIGSALTAGVKGIALAKGVKNLVSAGELINDVRKVTSTLTRSEKIVSALSSLPKKIVPLYGTVEDLTKLSKAGAGTLQLATAGAGAIKRELAIFNMARSESIFESASTFANLKDRLIQEHIDATGYAPDSETLERISQSSENASYDNFKTNLGVLTVMNRLQFDNMLKSFNGTRKLFNEGVSSLADDAFTVTAKVGDKTTRKAYQKGWFFGELGATGQIAKDFGKKTAAWEATKTLGRGFTKIEASEGVQELIQEASGKGLEQYYYDLYHGTKGYSGKLDSVMSSIQNPLVDMQGAKTFIMGALTGALISPGAKVLSRANQKIDEKFKLKGDPEYQSRDAKVEESVKLVNSLYENPAQFKQEWIANVKVQNKMSETMEEAAKNHNKYVYYNAKDSAFSKAIASAIKLDMFDSARDTIKELGEDMTDEEFEQTFSMNPSADKRKNVKEFMNTIAGQMEDYYTTYYNLKDKYGDKVLPDLYRNNKPEDYQKMVLAKKALDDAIEVLTTNVYKAKQSAKRASEIQAKIAAVPDLGSSSIELLTKMGSEQALGINLELLQKEIAGLESAEELSPEQQDLLKNKKEELELSKMWADSYMDIMRNDEESYSPAAEKRAYQSYTDLINLYNKVNKRNVTLTKEQIDSSFIDFIDYIRLNEDAKDYVDAMNVLADPTNFDIFINASVSAMTSVNQKLKEEHINEIRKINGTNIEENAPFPEEASDVPTETIPTLDEYLKEKHASLSENPNFTLPYDVWVKSGAANSYIKEYNKTYNKNEKLSTIPKAPTKKEESPADIEAKKADIEKRRQEGLISAVTTPISYEEFVNTKPSKVIVNNFDVYEYDKDLKKYVVLGAISSTGTSLESIAAREEGAKDIEFFKDKSLKLDTVNFFWSERITGRSPVTRLTSYKKRTNQGRIDEKVGDKLVEINTKYDAELAALEGNKPAESKPSDKRVSINGQPGVITGTSKDAAGITSLSYTLDNGTEGIIYKVGDRFRDGIDPENSDVVDVKVVKEEQPAAKTGKELYAEIESGKKMLFDFTDEERVLIDAYIAENQKAPEDMGSGLTAEEERQAMLDTELALEQEEEIGEEIETVEDYDQDNIRNRRDMEMESIDSNADFQVGLRQIAPADSLGNTTDLVNITFANNTTKYERGEVNSNYVFDVATADFKKGQPVIYRVITDYSVPYTNRTGATYTKDQVFTTDGKIKADMEDHARIGIYSMIGNEETLIGHLHTPEWISYMVDGKFPHIVIPESEAGSSNPKTLQKEVARNRALRKQIIDGFNKNPNFEAMGSVTDKSIGVLRTSSEQGLIANRVNPAIGKGGVENPHGKFAIVRQGSLQIDKGTLADNTLITKSFDEENIGGLEGVPVLLLPTSTGFFFPTFITLPKVTDTQSEFIIQAWKAFNNPANDSLKIVPAVYKSLGLEMGDTPSMGVLQEYISSYITNLNKNPLSPTGTAEGISKSGIARLNISQKGTLFLQSKDSQGVYHDIVLKKGEKVPDNLKELMGYLRTTVRFKDANHEGINSETPVTFLSVNEGKLVKETMPYNEYIMKNARTFVDKGVDAAVNSDDWVYFANPVIKLSISTPEVKDVLEEEAKPEPVATSELDEPRQGIAEKLMALKKAQRLTDDQIEERKKECGGGVGRMQDIG